MKPGTVIIILALAVFCFIMLILVFPPGGKISEVCNDLSGKVCK